MQDEREAEADDIVRTPTKIRLRMNQKFIQKSSISSGLIAMAASAPSVVGIKADMGV